jgi:hypothetical protein
LGVSFDDLAHSSRPGTIWDSHQGAVAQLGRAPRSQRGGHGFKSRQLHPSATWLCRNRGGPAVAPLMVAPCPKLPPKGRRRKAAPVGRGRRVGGTLARPTIRNRTLSDYCGKCMEERGPTVRRRPTTTPKRPSDSTMRPWDLLPTAQRPAAAVKRWSGFTISSKLRWLRWSPRRTGSRHSRWRFGSTTIRFLTVS